MSKRDKQKKAKDLQRRRMRSLPDARRPGRNDRCPCGSGDKYKKCCGDGEAVRKWNEKWEADEVRRWQKWQEEGSVSGLPPEPIMRYAEKQGIILNDEHRNYLAEKKKEQRSASMNIASVAALASLFPAYR